MVAALGVNQKWLFTSVFALGVFLAALGGALQIPRDAVHHALDLRIIVDVFVVVVIGGLGSIIGAFVAAVLVSELNAFGILIFPKISIILVFLVMAAVLTVRPWGRFGKQEAAARRTPGLTVNPWRPLTSRERMAAMAALPLAAALPLIGGNYALTVGSEIAIFVIFAASLHFLMSVGGLASFGHAAYFGLGAYGVAFLAKLAGLPMIACLLLGPLLGCLGEAVFAFFAVQLSGVYFAMLTLAFALFAYLKGSVFPDSLGISLSVDALVMVLLGGVETVSGAVIGAIVYKALSIWLVSQTDLSKLVLGAVIVLFVVAFPKGVVGMLETIRSRRTQSSKSALLGSRVEIAE